GRQSGWRRGVGPDRHGRGIHRRPGSGDGGAPGYPRRGHRARLRASRPPSRADRAVPGGAPIRGRTMSASTRAKVLLVDDQEENLIALEAVLEPLAPTLVCPASGHEALGLLLRDEFALILMD